MANHGFCSAASSCILSLLATVVAPITVYAEEDELSSVAGSQWMLSANAGLVTDYVFRGVSQTRNGPAIQGGFDAGFNSFYAGVWASSIDFGANSFGREIADIEIDYYAGFAPAWKNIIFDLGAVYITYPGAYDPAGEYDYLEVITEASYTINDKLTLSAGNYWSPEYLGETGQGDALELSADYAFNRKLFEIFSPRVSAMVARQWVEKLPDYTYWNVGLSLDFHDNWTVDLRYWDTDFNEANCIAFNGFDDTCGAKIVGSIKAAF